MTARPSSPRWSIGSLQRLRKNGAPYLDRRRLLQTPWFGVYLHRIHTTDADRDPHNHPWWFASIVLAGGYTEHVWDDPAQPATHRVRVRGRGSLRALPRYQAHRIVAVDGHLRTLVVTGPHRAASWGFWPNGRYVPWRDYLTGRIWSLPGSAPPPAVPERKGRPR